MFISYAAHVRHQPDMSTSEYDDVAEENRDVFDAEEGEDYGYRHSEFKWVPTGAEPGAEKFDWLHKKIHRDNRRRLLGTAARTVSGYDVDGVQSVVFRAAVEGCSCSTWSSTAATCRWMRSKDGSGGWQRREAISLRQRFRR